MSAYCLQCKARLQLMGGSPVTCPCNWRKKAKANRKPNEAILPPLPYIPPAPPKKLIVPGVPKGPNGVCRYCGREMGINYTKRFEAEYRTTDHFLPRFTGGTNDPKNRVLCCRKCNEMKASFSPIKMLEVWHEIDPNGLAEAVKKIIEK